MSDFAELRRICNRDYSGDNYSPPESLAYFPHRSVKKLLDARNALVIALGEVAKREGVVLAEVRSLKAEAVCQRCKSELEPGWCHSCYKRARQGCPH